MLGGQVTLTLPANILAHLDRLSMLHTFTGPVDLQAFWAAVAEQRGRILSTTAATFCLRCSYERLYQLIEGGEIEAWVYHPAADAAALHCMVSIPSVVRQGIREGRFRSATDKVLVSLNVSEAEFTLLQAEAFRGECG